VGSLSSVDFFPGSVEDLKRFGPVCAHGNEAANPREEGAYAALGVIGSFARLVFVHD